MAEPGIAGDGEGDLAVSLLEETETLAHFAANAQYGAPNLRS
jgi:hypothetical protein